MPSQRHYQGLGADRTFASDTETPRLRRVHKKSRAGCHECKRRHLKCDEARPACSRCTRGKRSCRYPESARNSTPPPSAPHSEAVSHTSGPEDDANAVPSPSATEAVNDFVLLCIGEDGELPISGWPLTREQVALVKHAEDNYLPFGSGDEIARALVKEVVQTAWTAPYLMDLIMSLASLHLAELNPSQNAMYRQQAMQLQTRGLTQFNEAKEDVQTDACLAMFLFSSFIGTTVLYETLRHRHDFNDFLDYFVSYLHLHRGVSAITAGAWPRITKTQIVSIHNSFPSTEETEALIEKGIECEELDEMLEHCDLGPVALETCRSTVHFLRRSFAIYHHLSHSNRHRSSSAMAFAVRIKSVFVDLIDQRQPEALVIIAHYAVLLHWCRDYWMFADGGAYIIRGITEHLGKYWHQWLSFPNKELEIGT